MSSADHGSYKGNRRPGRDETAMDIDTLPCPLNIEELPDEIKPVDEEDLIDLDGMEDIQAQKVTDLSLAQLHDNSLIQAQNEQALASNGQLDLSIHMSDEPNTGIGQLRISQNAFGLGGVSKPSFQGIIRFAGRVASPEALTSATVEATTATAASESRPSRQIVQAPPFDFDPSVPDGASPPCNNLPTQPDHSQKHRAHPAQQLGRQRSFVYQHYHPERIVDRYVPTGPRRAVRSWHFTSHQQYSHTNIDGRVHKCAPGPTSLDYSEKQDLTRRIVKYGNDEGECVAKQDFVSNEAKEVQTKDNTPTAIVVQADHGQQHGISPPFRSVEDTVMAEMDGRHGGGYNARRGNDRRGIGNDYRRHSQRGGAGDYHGPNDGGRKRRRDDYDDYDAGHQAQRPTRPLSRFKGQLMNVGESQRYGVVEEVVNIAKVFTDDAGDTYFVEIAAELMVKVVQEQPLRIPFVAAVVMQINLTKPQWVQEFLGKTLSQIQEYVDAGQWRSVKLHLRFLACMQSLLAGNGIMAFLEELFNKAADLQTELAEDLIGLELVKIILLTIPYAIVAHPESKSFATELLEKTAIIASTPRQDVTILSLNVNEPSDTTIARLQRQLEDQAQLGWPLKFLPQPFIPAGALVDIDGQEATTASKHALPALILPQTISIGSRTLFPEVYFSVIEDQEVGNVPATTDLAACVVRDTLVDTMNVLDFNRHAAARLLLELDKFWAPDAFVKRAVPFDRLRDREDFPTTTWKPEDVAIDAVFSQMLRLPSPEHKVAYYHSVITELCHLAPQAFAPALGRTIRAIYKQLDTIDLEVYQRFMDWLAHHLSNFDFKWKWVEWIGVVEHSNLEPRKAFIIGLLDLEIRLSFAKRIRDTVPEQMQILVPAVKDNELPDYKFNNELTPHAPAAKELVPLLRAHKSDEEIAAIFNKIIASSAANDADGPSVHPNLAATDVYITTICYIGSKSLSHVMSHIDRQKERLVRLSADPVLAQPSPEAQRAQIISSVVSYWIDVAPSVAITIIDKLLNYSVLTPASIVEWALAPERIAGGRKLSEAWVYEMTDRTLLKAANHINKIITSRIDTTITKDKAEEFDKALAQERVGLESLFVTIEDAVSGVAQGDNEQMQEGEVGGDDMGAAGEHEMQTLKTWGQKWRRVFSRKRAVGQVLFDEAVKSFPEPREVELTENENGTTNGSLNTNGNGKLDVSMEADLVDASEGI